MPLVVISGMKLNRLLYKGEKEKEQGTADSGVNPKVRYQQRRSAEEVFLFYELYKRSAHPSPGDRLCSSHPEATGAPS